MISAVAARSATQPPTSRGQMALSSSVSQRRETTPDQVAQTDSVNDPCLAATAHELSGGDH